MLLADIASTGISAAETANVQIGQTVAVFAQGPIGLCATAGARLKGASLVIGVDAIEKRLHLSREMGADEVIDFTQEDPVAAIKRLTGGRGVDVAIEALGTQADLPVVPRGHAARAASSRASASTAASSRSRSSRSSTASATSRSSRRSAPAARSGCAR